MPRRTPQPHEINDIMWGWLLFSVLLGALPFFVRWIIALGCEDAMDAYDIKDTVYFGIAINISNFSLIRNKSVVMKNLVTGWSLLIVIFLIIFIAILQDADCEKIISHQKKVQIQIIHLITLVLVAGSLRLSYTTNLSVAKAP